MKQKVLFVCIHNSARSQIAEALLNRHCPEFFEAESAGLEPGTLNPLAVEALQEIGIDIAGKPTRKVFDLFRAGKLYAYVITVCDETSAERCPIFVGVTKRVHWTFPDPSTLTGTHAERLAKTCEIRDTIQRQIEAWCAEVCVAEPVA